MKDRGILIVDDEAGVNEVIAEWFRQDGVPTRCVESTREGLEMIAFRAPRIVVVDLRLDNPPTVDFAKDIRTHPVTESIPILIITGADIDEARQAVNDIKAVSSVAPTDFLIKPFTMDDLKQKIAEMVQSFSWITTTLSYSR